MKSKAGAAVSDWMKVLLAFFCLAVMVTACESTPTRDACLIAGDPNCLNGNAGNNAGGDTGTTQDGGSGGFTCTYPQVDCGAAACTNVLTDVNNCGSCHLTCGDGASCVYGHCVASCIASPEICNGIDDNCDGKTDEGFNLGSDCLTGIGACQRHGMLVCDGSGGVKCSATAGSPSTEICNGIDDNCNGTADEGLACACSPETEICDGVDNNCNGSVDEGFPVGAPCTVGIGSCKRVGIYLCDGLGGVKCSATAGAPSVETCNGLDDNCNGSADEGLSCTCSPTPEVCDGIDNDCDGTIDEGCPLGDQCLVGVGACERIGLYVADGSGGVKCSATPGAPKAETCNGIDDNCNGVADDGISCPVCVPKPELCDGVDNNCNGATDEGFGLGSTCTVGIGACQRTGLVVCNGPAATSCTAIPGTPGVEICNGIDDNCDGLIDEGLSCTCSPKPEICDGVDNNCDGTADELFPLGMICQVGVGACQRFGTIVCKPDGSSGCSATPGSPSVESCNGIDDNCNGSVDEGLSCVCNPSPEVCDGVDNNCNGKVDEGYPVGSQCNVGTGACSRTGFFICDPITGGVKCSATAGAPGVEICNGIDDNCNGSVDEGLSCTCGPSTELCDGVDNDCNGIVDDAFGVGTACTVGIGACQRFGVFVCNGVGGVKCSATAGAPSIEVCDGIDNDCDGTADEGLSCACSPKTEVCDGVDNDCNGTVDNGFPVGTTCLVGTGACQRTGIMICDGLGGIKCSATPGTPSAEVCDGVDNNCNGSADEGLSCTCSPKPETCNGVDDNCNGTVDEGYPVGSQCTVGTGACSRTGIFVCDPITGGVKCTATPGAPATETCNGIDDNCNGSIDEGISCPVCIPKVEVCDGVDNDCDGTADEGLGIGSACTVGVGACQRFGINVCDGIGGVKCSATPGAPSTEICNGIDDNCDGTADEGLSCACSPKTEVCDGIDNNCNGTVDEGFLVGTACTVGIGACQRTGIIICNGSGGTKCSATPGIPSAEVCDGVDNNCNGTADEGLSCACSPKTEVCDGVDNNCNGTVDEGFLVGTACTVGVGACHRVGVLLCNAGGTTSCSATAGTPAMEICNGIDDNCDGSIDEGISCPVCVPKAEVCNGIDDNCDGVADEGFALGSTCMVGVGSCARTGITICNGSGGTTCSATPGAPTTEICNGVDDNCNGTADEGLSCSCSPKTEVCDGVDNNCNGTVDEGFLVGTACTVGIGACTRHGIIICNGSGGTVCSATAGTAKAETCNGVDDDCNGIVDNGLVCSCSAQPEVCDGVDNNCNGTVDEGFSVGTTCAVGIGACRRVGFIICNGLGGTTCSATAGSATPEICGDGIDNNCNGTIDEPACL